MFKRIVLIGSAVVLVCATFGCANKNMDTTVTDLERTVKTKDSEITKLEGSVSQLERDLAAKQKEAEAAARAKADAEAAARDAEARAKSAASSTGTSGGSARSGSSAYASKGSEMYPPNAKSGECYARVFVPPVTKTETQQVLRQEASERIEVVPATYAWGEEKVLVKEATSRMVEVPAEYKWVEEKILVKEAHTTWKKGRGPVEKVDNATGEILCLVDVPAVYKTVRQKVIAKPATTKTVQIPAEYKTVKVQTVATPPKERRIEIPAKYETVTSTVQVSGGEMEWREILCETNMTGSTIRQVQSALQKAGHNPGPIDGIFGSQTSSAIRSFQRSKGLPTGGLTMATLQKLGVKL